MKRILFLDTALSRRLVIPPDSGWRPFAGLTAHLGDGPYVFVALGLLYLAGWWWNLPAICQADLIIILVVFTTMILVTLLKFVVRRQRPRPPGEFVAFQYDQYSFPSGHAARLAALSIGVLQLFPAAGWPVMVLAMAVALARVGVGVHYLGDIIAGLMVGTMVAWLSINWLQTCLPMLTF